MKSRQLRVILILSGHMKRLLSVLILVLFGLAVFIPQETISTFLYWSMFLGILILLVVYWFVSYWVSLEKAAEVIAGPIRFSLFCAKVPPATSEDLVRGRLVIAGNQISLIQRKKDKGKPVSFVSVWDYPIDRITAISFAKVVGWRNGFVLELDKNDQASFVSIQARRLKPVIIEALGWNTEE